MPIRDLSTLGLDQLLGALLSAVVNGQREATASTLALIEQIGLVHGDDGEERFRTVTVRYTKLDENQQPAEFVLEVPLLAMVAIPTLTVRSSKVSFRYDITETSVEKPPEDARAVARPLGDLAPQQVVLKGFVPRSRTTRETRETAGVEVEVTVESTQLPLGLERLLDLTELTVTQPAKNKRP
ncbi:DUF2589 domain-containing protein [Streptomyces sp. NBC_00490]|uniref:DUF2589 domain-containing protein n=1 Tax=Streptomyces sp. NBC_00490 TaxID=2903657 RepID=UPI002E194612